MCVEKYLKTQLIFVLRQNNNRNHDVLPKTTNSIIWKIQIIHELCSTFPELFDFCNFWICLNVNDVFNLLAPASWKCDLHQTFNNWFGSRCKQHIGNFSAKIRILWSVECMLMWTAMHACNVILLHFQNYIL